MLDDASKSRVAKSYHPRRSRGPGVLRNVLGYYWLYRKFQRYTLIPRETYIANLYLVGRQLAREALDAGCIVECGTWRGGMAAGLSSIGGAQRHYFFFDSFEGLPPATAEDGASAKGWQETRDGTILHDNCTASLQEFMEAMSLVDIPRERLHVTKGFFEDSFKDVVVPPIAILRLDADWYASTMLCLETFWDQLLPNTLVLIDDYYAWEGCRKAVHAFLARRQASEAIRQSRFGKVAYIIKT